jgi:hypothetical protein
VFLARHTELRSGGRSTADGVVVEALNNVI